MQVLIAHKPIIVAIFASAIAMVLMAFLLYIGDRLNHTGSEYDKCKD